MRAPLLCAAAMLCALPALADRVVDYSTIALLYPNGVVLAAAPGAWGLGLGIGMTR